MYLVFHLKVLHELEVHEHSDGCLGGLSFRQVKVAEAEVQQPQRLSRGNGGCLQTETQTPKEHTDTSVYVHVRLRRYHVTRTRLRRDQRANTFAIRFYITQTTYVHYNQSQYPGYQAGRGLTLGLNSISSPELN